MNAVNFPYIRFVKFEVINTTPSEIQNTAKVNKRIKHQFYLHLNCRKYRGMKNFYNLNPEQTYCSFQWEGHTLIVKANEDLIVACREILASFDNPIEVV